MLFGYEADQERRHPMELLEELMGTCHLLQDDWNRLGWEFGDLPGEIHVRVLTLVNYTECKAEGGEVTIHISTNYSYGDVPRGGCAMYLMYSNGSGPHGIPWYDRVVSGCGMGLLRTFASVDELKVWAAQLQADCQSESRSSYWYSWLNENPLAHATWLNRKYKGLWKMQRDMYEPNVLAAVQQELDRMHDGERAVTLTDTELEMLLEKELYARRNRAGL